MSTPCKIFLLAAALAAFVLINLVGSRLPWRVDLTADQLYSVSGETIELLSSLPESVEFRFFFSRQASGLPTLQKNYGQRVENMLRRYAALAPDQIRLSILDPIPDSPEEEEALRAGLSPQRLPSGEAFFFGLEIAAGGNRQIIPFFQPRREPFLEYDLSQAVRQVNAVEQPVVGIITSLDLFAPPPAVPIDSLPRAPDAVFIEELRRTYEVRRLGREAIPEDLDLLLIIHPRAISPAQQFSIDQFLLSGRPVFLAVDPSSASLRKQFPEEARMAALGGRTASDLPDLLTGWGLRYNSRQVVGDPDLATEIQGSEETMVRFPVWMTFRQFNRDLAPTASLREILIAEGGSLQLRQNHLQLRPILVTGPRSGEMMASALTVVRPAEVARQLSADGQERVVAGLITGKFRSAFPSGPPTRNETEDFLRQLEVESGRYLQESVSESTLFVIADSDFLTEPFSVQPINFLGRSGVAPINDNLALALNMIDYLAGDQVFLGLRGKGSASRPFERVARLRAAAEEQYRHRLQNLERRLRAVEEEMAQWQREEENAGEPLAMGGWEEIREEFRAAEISLRAERRELRRALREQTVVLERSLVALNLLAVPVGIGLFSVFFFARRQRWEHRARTSRSNRTA